MLTILNAWTAILAIIAALEQPRMDRLAAAAPQLHPGDNEQQVLAVLGPPDVRWQERTGLAIFLFGRLPPQWSYGTLVDFDNLLIADAGWPNPLPFKIRVFGPKADDVVVIWRKDGAVDSVDWPQHD